MDKKNPYNTDRYCPIDNSKMEFIEDDNSKHFYHCGNCGFQYWFVATKEQIREEQEKYMQRRSDKKNK